jgi:hypothetical protein
MSSSFLKVYLDMVTCAAAACCAMLCRAMPCCAVLVCAADRYPVGKMQDFVKRLHASGQRWIPITDAGVAAAEGYGAYEKGLAMDVFVKDHKGKPYMGQVRSRWQDA